MLGMLWKVEPKSLPEPPFLGDIFGLKKGCPWSVIFGILKFLFEGDIKSPIFVDLKEGLFSRTILIWAGI